MRYVIAIIVIIMIALIGWMLYSNLGMNRIDTGSGILLQPPKGVKQFSMQHLFFDGDIKSIAWFADSLNKSAEHLQQFALVFQHENRNAYYLFNFNTHEIIFRQAQATGTITQIAWRGSIFRRIEYAKERNTFSGPGLSEPEQKNLYH